MYARARDMKGLACRWNIYRETEIVAFLRIESVPPPPRTFATHKYVTHTKSPFTLIHMLYELQLLKADLMLHLHCTTVGLNCQALSLLFINRKITWLPMHKLELQLISKKRFRSSSVIKSFSWSII